MSKKKHESSGGLHTDVMVVDEVASLNSVKVPEEKKEEKFGIVTATMLNVRERPIATANPIHILKKGTGVVIDTSFTSPDWFKITTNSDTLGVYIEGYVMKRFIKIKE